MTKIQIAAIRNCLWKIHEAQQQLGKTLMLIDDPSHREVILQSSETLAKVSHHLDILR